MKVSVFEKAKLPAGATKAALARAARAALEAERCEEDGELNVILVADAEMRRLNKRYLSHDRTTDVIAFRYPTDPAFPAGETPAFGDVFVSVPQARRQAKALGHGVAQELLTLVLHGTLHLLGYDDHRPKDKARMFARQDELLAALAR